MIEKYFRTGIRFRWTKPQDGPAAQLDRHGVVLSRGAIVDSRREAAPLIYDGIDGQLFDPTLRHVDVRSLGFVQMRMPIYVGWLDYTPGYTSRKPTGPYDILTGYMSGCIIAWWWSNGVRYVGHVGTVNNPVTDRLVKRTFGFTLARLPHKDARGFEPASVWTFAELAQLANQIQPHPQTRIFGLVTTLGRFYSVAMLQLPGNEWCVGGCKQVQPILYNELMLRMIRDS
jgi:hypothetical protein